MSCQGDSRGNFETKIAAQCLKISLAQAPFLRKRFQRLTQEKTEHLLFARPRCRRRGSQCGFAPRKNRPSQVPLAARLLLSRNARARGARMSACLSDTRLRPAARLSGIFICPRLAN